MCVVQQIRLDQVFEIAFFCQFFQLIVDRKLLQVGERFVLVVQPAVEAECNDSSRYCNTGTDVFDWTDRR